MNDEYISHNRALMDAWCEHFNQVGACPVICIGIRYIDGQLTLVTVENYELQKVLKIIDDAARYMRQTMQ